MDGTVVVFLDFDGVLRPGPVKQDALVWLPALAELLEPYPEVRIIVSSDHRCGTSDDALRELLGPLGPRFLGVVESFDEFSRAAEILVEVKRRGLSRWLAIDDHSSVVAAASWEPAFVACDPAVGLSCPSVQTEIRGKLLKMGFKAGDAGSANHE